MGACMMSSSSYRLLGSSGDVLSRAWPRFTTRPFLFAVRTQGMVSICHRASRKTSTATSAACRVTIW